MAAKIAGSLFPNGRKILPGFAFTGASPIPIFVQPGGAVLDKPDFRPYFGNFPCGLWRPSSDPPQNPEPNENWKCCVLSLLSALIGWAMLNDSAPKGESQRADRPAE
jgi:hypothetical protein